MTSSVSSLTNIPPRDNKLVQEVVDQLKSNGIFDQLRRDCLADVDTKPAYQNLRQRVEGYVSNFLCKQTWRPDLNKNQLRDQLRRQINQSGMLLNGVDRIIDQVVNPKIFSLFKPEIEKVVYNYLGIDKEQILAQHSAQPTNILPQGSNTASGITFPPFNVGQNISFTNFNPGSSPISPYNTYSPYNQSQPTSFSYKQPQQAAPQSQTYNQPTQTPYVFPLTPFNANGGPNTTILNPISMATESPEKDITAPSLEVDLQSANSVITHQQQDSDCFEQMIPASRCNEFVVDFKKEVIVCKESNNNNTSGDKHYIRKLEFEVSADNLEPKEERMLKIDIDESYIRNERIKEKKLNAQRKSNFDVTKTTSKSFENKRESKSLKLKSSSFDRHYPDSPKGKLEFFKSKSPVKADKIKVNEDKTKGNGSDDLKYKSKCIDDKSRIKTVEESKGKHGENEENKCKITDDGKLKSKSEDSKSKSSHKDDGKLKYKVFDNAKQKNKYQDEEKSKNKINDLEKTKNSGNEEKNKSKTCDLKVKSEERLREDKFKNDEKINSLFRPDKLKLLKNKFKLINVPELKSKPPSSDSKSSSDSSKSSFHKSEGKSSSESQGLYDSKSSSEGYSSSSDKQKISPIPIKKSKPDKLSIKPIKPVQSNHPKTKLFPDEKKNKEETLETKVKLNHDGSSGNSEKGTAVLDTKHDVGDLSDADSLAGWSDITVSSVHTCDLSSFDEEITLTSSDDDEDTTKLNAEKTKTIIANSAGEALKPVEDFAVAEVHDDHPIEQKAKPKRLISLMGRYSDSDDEETKEEKRARMANAKEIRAERRAKLREKLEEKRKQTESIMAKIQEIKEKKTKMTFEKVVAAPSSKPEEKSEEKKSKRIATSSIKETLKQHKVIEKKMALRRQRKINRRYMSDEFYFPKSLALCTMQSSQCSQEEEQSDNLTDFSQTDTSCSEKFSNDSPLKRPVKTLTLVTLKDDDEAVLSPVESLPPTPTQDEQFFPSIPKQDQNSNSSIPIVEIQTPTPTYLSKLSHSDIPVIYSERQPSRVIDKNRRSFKRHSDTSHGSAPSSTKSSSSLGHEDDRQRTKIASSRRQSLPEPSSDRLSKSKVSRSSENYASQRYDDSDLYKPRPIIPSSRRSRGSPPPQQLASQSNRGYSPERKRPRYSPPPRNMISLRESKLQEEERLRMSHIISSQSLNSNQELISDSNSNDVILKQNPFLTNFSLMSGMTPVIYTNQEQQTVDGLVDSAEEIHHHHEIIKDPFLETILLED